MWTRSMGAALLSVLMAWPAAAQNAANDWSLKAQNVITAGRSPASSEYLLALVHATMYNAVVAIEGEYRPFLVRVEVDHPASADAAVGAAAYHVLRQRVPAAESSLTAEYVAYVSALPEGSAISAARSQPVAALSLRPLGRTGVLGDDRRRYGGFGLG